MKAAKIFAAVVALVALFVGPANAMITFEEFAVGTSISNQYAAQGVLFAGGPASGFVDPIIANDGPFQVLSPFPPYNGDFGMHFINPAVWVEFDAGVWNDAGTGVINVYDPFGGLLGSFTNSQDWNVGDPFVYEHFSFNGMGPIGDIYFNSFSDVAGAAMDNLDFAPVPEPATLALLGLGLVGLGTRLRKRNK